MGNASTGRLMSYWLPTLLANFSCSKNPIFNLQLLCSYFPVSCVVYIKKKKKINSVILHFLISLFFSRLTHRIATVKISLFPLLYERVGEQADFGSVCQFCKLTLNKVEVKPSMRSICNSLHVHLFMYHVMK